MKKQILMSGICATVFAIMAVLSVVSCNSDEEYYEGVNYTLASKRITRGAPEGSNGIKVGAGYVHSGQADCSLNLIDNVVYNYRLEWSGGDMETVKATIIPIGNYSVPPKKVSSEISVKYKPVWGYKYSRIVLI